MKNPILKDTFREIKKTKSRFFSIFAIVAIGVAFFAGIFASAPTMRYNADKYFDDYNLMDYRILSNFGLTDDDIEEIRQIEGVEGVQPAYSVDVLVNDGQSQKVMRVHSLSSNHMKQEDPDYINQLIVVEGRLPSQEGEIVVEKTQMLENTFKVGTQISLNSGTSDSISDSLNTDTFTIVGIVETPYYLSFQKGSSSIGSGSLGCYGYVLDTNFNMEVYTEAFLTIQGAKQWNSYEDEYFDYLQPSTQRLETLGIERSSIRKEEILDEVLEEYNKGLKEYEEAVSEFDEEIKKAEKELEDADRELLKGEMTLQNNRDLTNLRFEMVQQEIDSNKTTIETLRKTYDQVNEEYEKENAEILEEKQKLEAELEKAKLEEQAKQAEYDQAEQEYQIIANKVQKLTDLKDERSTLQQEIVQLNADLVILQIQISTATSENKPELERQYNEKLDLKNTKQARLDEVENEITLFEEQNSNLTDEYNQAELKKENAETELQQAILKKESYESSIATIDELLKQSRGILDQLETELKKVEKQLEDGEKALEEGKLTAEQEFKKAEKQLADSKVELEKGKLEFEKQKQEGEEKLLEAKEELVKAKDEIEAIEDGKWYVLDRNSHYSYVDYRGATERMDAIAIIFPVFFFTVAALVCLTTMTRMVDEQRTQIGTMKALGYKTRTIAFKYVFYAAFASFTGSICGLAFGLIAFPAIIYTAWNMMYILPPVSFTTHFALMFISTLISVCVTTCAAFFACYSELMSNPSSLMRPKAPKVGKKILLERIDWIWKHFSFTSKVTARNIFRYKKRFFMTVIGISGCTALLVAGFGLKDSINAIVDVQYGQVFHYIGVATLKEDTKQERIDEISLDLEKTEEIDRVMDVHSVDSKANFDGKSIDITLMVVDDTDEFKEFVDLHQRVSQKELVLSSSGIIITEHTANQLNVKVGDKLSIENEEGTVKEFEVEGIAENYVGHYVYMTSTCYLNQYEYRAFNNSYLIKVNPDIAENDAACAERITAYDEIESLSFYSSVRDNFKSMIKSLDYIVVVLIISAGALAFVVLYNLTNVNISERLREIATLKVLGFNDKEVNDYVYMENIILTFVGSIAGIFLGKLLHLAIMVMVELDNVMFGRVIHIPSFIYSVLITLVFGMIVNQVMKKKLRAIPMVESLKSVE